MGQGGNAAEPRDMPLMPPFYDISLVSNVFMLTDLRCCGQYRGLSISCTYNSGKDFKIWTRTRHFSSLYPFSFPDYLSACFASLQQRPRYNEQFFWYHGTLLQQGFHKNPANKLWLARKEELRQAGFQFDLLNAPNLLATSMPKNNSKRLLILRATQAKVTRHDCQKVLIIFFSVGFHCTCKKSPPQTTSWLALLC